MKTRFVAPFAVAALATTLVYAGPADDVAAAAKKLADAPNYSWTATTEIANSQFPAMPVEGVTEKGGATVFTRTFGDNTFQTVRKGEQVVMQNRDGDWVTLEEWRQQFGGGGGGRGRGASQMTPAEEVGELAAKLKDVTVADGAIVGTLSAEDAAPLVSFFGRGGGTPAKNASGEMKIWLKDGALVKYVVAVKGTVTTPDGEERNRERTTTTEIKNVGSTKVAVPEGAKKKLGTT